MVRRHKAIAITVAIAAFSIPPGLAAVDKIDTSYRLGSGDKLRIIVFGEEALSGEFTVDATGRLAMPLIGEIDAAGVSPATLQARIAAALSQGFLNAPKVSAEVLNYRPFYILGEVNKPGEYPFVNGLTVMNAVAQAQGFTYRASTRKVLIRHAGADAERQVALTSVVPVSPGDTIRIKERWF